MDANLNPIPELEWDLYQPICGLTMLELGNKKIGNDTYKAYFESIGIQHTSVDWNGMDGAIALDLRSPVELGSFDMVTNIGTTEHVSDQMAVWENIHRAINVGGVFISTTPLEGNWWWHGEHYPRPEFYEQFAELNGYRLERLTKEKEYPSVLLFARMVKIADLQFTMPGDDTIYYNSIRDR